MNEFQSINDIISAAVKDSSYVSVLISSIVFILYTFVSKIIDYFKVKNNNKPMIEMVSTVKSLGDNIAKLNNGLDKMFQDNQRKEIVRCKNVIELTFVSFKNNIECICRDIIIHNNIEKNKEYIVANISQTVSTEYYKLHSQLSLYDVDNISISTFLKEEWIEDIVKHLINIIYNKQNSQERISQVISYLKIVANEHSTYIYNKTFN